MKRFVTLALVLTLVVSLLAGCGGAASSASVATPSGSAPAVSGGTGAKPYIAVVSKGFQHQFWQTVAAGSEAAAKEYNVDITFEGPASESDISAQVDMVNAALAKKPAALCLAALDTQSLNAQLEDAKAKGIPVIGFDSGVPGAPEGSIISTASTNNYAAGALAAEEMFKEAGFAEKLKAATKAAPVSVAVQSQDATSASVVDRTQGFIDKMLELANGVHADGVEVVGHDVFKVAAKGDVAVSIKVSVPPTTSYDDATSAATAMLQNTKNLIGYFCSNEASVTGILAATNDGTDLDRENGKYKDLIVVGFDAGATQKTAIEKNYFYGSITQDPYMIGYLAVELAVKALNGEKVEEVVDTGCKFYNSSNMKDADIAQLLYD